MPNTLWDRIVGRNKDSLDPQTLKISIHQFQAAVFEAASTIDEPPPPGTKPWDKTWTGKTVLRSDVVTEFNLSAEQDEATANGDRSTITVIDLLFLLEIYDQSSDPVNVKNYIDNVMLCAETEQFSYDTDSVAIARLELIAAN